MSAGDGTRVLYQKTTKTRGSILADIPSAPRAAFCFARLVVSAWRHALQQPDLASAAGEGDLAQAVAAVSAGRFSDNFALWCFAADCDAERAYDLVDSC